MKIIEEDKTVRRVKNNNVHILTKYVDNMLR